MINKTAEPLPTETDIAIIGGGIIGVSAAYFLAERGIHVTLLEKGRIAGEQSSRNWGFVRKQGRDPAEMPLIIDSLRLWEQLAAKLDEDIGFRRHGTLYLANATKTLSGYEDWLKVAQAYQLDSRLLSSREIAALLPAADKSFAGGLYTASDARAEPGLAVPAMARAAERLGATIIDHCAVRSLDLAAGNVAGLVTERGAIKCSTVILAAGAWSRAFCRNLGLTLPQMHVKSSVLRTAPAANVAEQAIWTPSVALRRRLDGGYSVANTAASQHELVPDSFRFFFTFMPAYLSDRRRIKLTLNQRFWEALKEPTQWRDDEVSPFEQCRTLDPQPSRKILAQAHQELGLLFPQLKNIEIAQSWAGRIDVMPDEIPVISEVASHPGLIIATGFSGHGFGIGPGAGHLLADMASGVRGRIDPHGFRFERFSA